MLQVKPTLLPVNQENPHNVCNLQAMGVSPFKIVAFRLGIVFPHKSVSPVGIVRPFAPVLRYKTGISAPAQIF